MERLPDLSGETIHEYAILDEISRGGFGVVYQVEDVTTGIRYAMKILYPSDENEEEYNREVSAFDLLSSDPTPGCYPYIVCLHDDFIHTIVVEESLPEGDLVTSRTTYYILVLELMEGDFWDVVDTKIAATNAYTALSFMKMLLEGLAFMHSKGMAHRDIKPRNILYQPEMRVVDGEPRMRVVAKYTDFGLACTDERHPDLLSTLNRCGAQGSPPFVSPGYVAVMHKAPSLEMAQKDDVWALGVVFRQMVSGRYPIPDINVLMERESATGQDILEEILIATTTEPVRYDTDNAKLDPIVVRVIEDMSILKAEDRPTAQALLDYIVANE